MFDLIVVHAFGDYRKGDRITDASKIEAILGSTQSAHVVKVPRQPTTH